MLKNKKLIIIISIIIVVLIIAVIFALLLLSKNKEEENNIKNESGEEKIIQNAEELENSFNSLFTNVEYLESETSLVQTVFELEKNEERKYSINVHLPKINLETENVKEINDEIINLFGKKIINVLKDSQEFTMINIDYISYINNNILSLVIKCTLKEGSNPQRIIIKTYNYNLKDNEIVTLKSTLENKNLDLGEIQTKIINDIRAKSTTSAALAEQGYNVYVRDIRSDEYLIENINTFFIGQDGAIYVVFAYGNNNYTETTDVIVFN